MGLLFIIAAITLLGSTVDALVSQGRAAIPAIVFQNFVYTASCSIFCSFLLVLIYARLRFPTDWSNGRCFLLWSSWAFI